jgi:VWFA-related protein
VLIPVVVRDKQGHPVADLKQQDFQVFDNDKPHPISGFSVEKRGITQPTSGSDSQLPTSQDPATHAMSKPTRFVVFLFDDMHLSVEDLAAAKKAAATLFAGTLADSDMAAVVAISGKPNSGLTTDRAKLQEAILGLQPRALYRTGNADCPSIDYYQADLIENKHDAGALQDAVMQILACAPTLPEIAAAQAHNAARRVFSAGDQDVQVTFASITEFVRRMASLPGQRVLILVSPGFLTISPQSLAAESHLIDLAAQSSVTISALDARGVFTTEATASDDTHGRNPGQMGELRRSAMALATGPLVELTDGSGGVLVQNTNDLDAGLKRLAEPAEYTYILELSLDNMKPDGSYHRLKVKLATEGDQLQTRRGYFMPKPEKAK